MCPFQHKNLKCLFNYSVWTIQTLYSLSIDNEQKDTTGLTSFLLKTSHIFILLFVFFLQILSWRMKVWTKFIRKYEFVCYIFKLKCMCVYRTMLPWRRDDSHLCRRTRLGCRCCKKFWIWSPSASFPHRLVLSWRDLWLELVVLCPTVSIDCLWRQPYYVLYII